MPRQKFIAITAMLLVAGSLFYILYHFIFSSGEEWGMLQWFGIINTLILYVTIFELMAHTSIESFKGLAILLLAPIIIMAVLWLPSMYLYGHYYNDWADAIAERNAFAGFIILILAIFVPLWPAVIFGLLTKAMRGV